jgi:Uma2 family endonuclease
MYAMEGSSASHNQIVGNFYGFLHRALRPHRCRAFVAAMKVLVPEVQLYAYPDLVIACGDIQYADENEDVLLNPSVIVEVLSESTAVRDRGWKFHSYCASRSLVDYVLVSQDEPLIQHFVLRPADNWSFEFVAELDATLNLAALDLSIPLRTIYRDVQFGPEAGNEPN